MAKRGETKERILSIATEVFFKNGYEATSVKMILNEAGIVTGSFYHFFPSKEALFEAVIEQFLQNYTERVCLILKDETLTIEEQFRLFMQELKRVSDSYDNELQGERLHWTMQHALHNKTVEAMVAPLSEMLDRHICHGVVKSRLDVDTITLAAILLRGIEAIIHGNVIHPSDKKEKVVARNEIMSFIGLILESA